MTVSVVPASVPPGARLLIVGQAPGVTEAKQGKPFVGRDGQQLREWLRRVGIDPETVAYDNVHHEFTGNPTYKPTKAEEKAGAARLDALITELRPTVVLLLGGPAAHYRFTGTMGAMTGRQELTDGTTYIAAYHPGYYRNALRNGTQRQAAEAESAILGVLYTVVALLTGTGSGIALPEGRYVGSVVVRDFQAIDVETYGATRKETVDPRVAQFICAATSPAGQITFDIPHINSTARLLVHNVPYDGVVLRVWDCEWDDTKMLAHMMGEPDTTLKGLALRYLDRPMYTYSEAARLCILPEYCLGDAAATWDLFPVLAECMDDSVLALYRDLERKLFPLWIKMTLDGAVYLDHEALRRYEDADLGPRVDALHVQTEDALPRGRTVKRCTVCDLRAQAKQRGQRCDDGKNHRWEITYLADEPVNLNSPLQLLPALQSLGIPISSTTADELTLALEQAEGAGEADEVFDEAMEEWVGPYPVLRLLLDYRKAKKEESTYVLPWLRVPEGERLGCIWNPHGTWTMRISARNPNMQNIPNPLWRFFHAGEGHTLLSFDHSQLELRIAAHFSQDPFMLAAFTGDGDMHAATMERLNITDRRLAKIFNFGSLYDTHGTGAGFQQNARKYGVTLDWATISEAQMEMRRLIPTYFQWQRVTMHNHRVPGLFGMIHVVPQGGYGGHQENEAVNAPIQGGGALVTKYGMLRLHEAGYEVVCQIHDSITVRVPNAYVEEAKRDIPRIMETAIPHPLRVPLKVDLK